MENLELDGVKAWSLLSHTIWVYPQIWEAENPVQVKMIALVHFAVTFSALQREGKEKAWRCCNSKMPSMWTQSPSCSGVVDRMMAFSKMSTLCSQQPVNMLLHGKMSFENVIKSMHLDMDGDFVLDYPGGLNVTWLGHWRMQWKKRERFKSWECCI